MRYFLFVISISLIPGFSANAQYYNVADDEVEVGIVEKLDKIIPLDLKFQNEEDVTVTLGELIDKPTILSFVYFDCPGLCPPLLAGVSDVIDKLDMKLGEDYQCITISFNPKDSPQKAREKKLNYVQDIPEGDRQYWTWLTGTQDNIKTITDSVGWRFKPQGVDFAHPSAIIIISPQGKITRYLYGLNYLPFDVKMALIEAQKGLSRPTINKILEVCFAYDPGSRTYTLQITRVVGAMMILAALIVLIVLIVKGRRKSA
jgi:protein SCO1/2